MGKVRSFIKCDEKTKDVLWEALYAAAGVMLNEAKKDLKMYRMAQEHPEWKNQKDDLAFWRRYLAKDMAKYREIVQCREDWWCGMRIWQLPVDCNGRPLVKR